MKAVVTINNLDPVRFLNIKLGGKLFAKVAPGIVMQFEATAKITITQGRKKAGAK